MSGFRSRIKFVFLMILILVINACAHHYARKNQSDTQHLPQIGYTIQVGAFGVQKNAVSFTEKLRNNDLDAFYFIAIDKLYKVRFGDYATRKEAETAAIEYQKAGIIDNYYIVRPEKMFTKSAEKTTDLRRDIVKTAWRFLGCPYIYGGVTRDGFDCSGLVMTIYRLNGLNLPRVSRDQYKSGKQVKRSKLQAGDLVFFRTGSSKAITHVGIYIGQDEFIHAPGKGKKVRIGTLSNKYFSKCYAGSRNYIDG